MSKALEAIVYLLKRIRTDQSVADVIGFGTQSFELLNAALAELTDKPVWRVEAEMRGKLPEGFPDEVAPFDLLPWTSEKYPAAWSSGPFSYATNGAGCIRVPRQENVGGYPGLQSVPSGCLDIFADLENGAEGWNAVKPPASWSEQAVSHIDGGGSVRICEARFFRAALLARVAALPGCEIAMKTGVCKGAPGAALFRAEGLITAVLMPVRVDSPEEAYGIPQI